MEICKVDKKSCRFGRRWHKYFTTAKFKGADVYVTGDMYYHTAHDAMMIGLNIVDPGPMLKGYEKRGGTIP